MPFATAPSWGRGFHARSEPAIQRFGERFAERLAAYLCIGVAIGRRHCRAHARSRDEALVHAQVIVGHTGRREARFKCAAKSMEKIKTVAGEFDSFRIECTDYWSVGAASGENPTTVWYAPKAKAVVKVDHSNPSFAYELTSYTVK